jgi:hypothetical protein
MKASGVFSGGVLPFGFSVAANRRLVVVKQQQATIRRICALHAKGGSLREISAALARQGIRLSHVAVSRLLKEA